jgi:polar amino acid transport system permease protein
VVDSIWYLIVTTALSTGQHSVVGYYGRGAARDVPETALQRLRANLISLRNPGGAAPHA